jgi:tetratricopeptide (TPR) repeat protein
MVLLAVPTLRADTTGRVSGKVTTSDGKPVAGAVVSLSRVEVTWVKEIKTDANGAFFQVGLVPKDFDITVTAPGFAPAKERVKILLGEVVTKNITLLTPDEAAKAGIATAAASGDSAGAKEEIEATDAYNAGAGFYSAKDYSQALAPATKAYDGFKEALAKAPDDTVRSEVAEKLEKATRLLGMVQANLGKRGEAEPLLQKILEKNAKDGAVILALLKMAKDGKDKDGEAKYQKLLDDLEGPRPEIAYNEGVTALNAGDMKAAKAGAIKALAIKADYADGFYLLGIAEFGLNNLKASKEALKKYLELAPSGSKAGEVKEMLRSF